MPVNIVFNQILILAILVLIGIAGSKAGIITRVTKDFLARLIFNITLPSMLLTNFSRIELTPHLLGNSIMFLILAFVVVLFMFSTGWITSLIMGIKGGEAGIFRLHSMMGNIIYLGFPVISSLYGEEGLLYASIFTLVSNFLMWTIGVMTITNGQKVSIRKRLMHIFNLNTIAIVTGFALFLLSVKLPDIILRSVGGLGGTNTYLSMIYIGAVLFYADSRAAVRRRSVYVLSANRLLIVPVILTGIFYAVGHFFPGAVDPLVVSVIVMQSAMPCMVNVVIMANIFGADDTLATANVFVSTLLSIITLPAVLLVLRLAGS